MSWQIARVQEEGTKLERRTESVTLCEGMNDDNGMNATENVIEKVSTHAHEHKPECSTLVRYRNLKQQICKEKQSDREQE